MDMKRYNEKKVCFIICSNKECFLEECILYINQLTVPEGYSVEILAVQDAKSMTSAYNEAMNQSDARYKVYLHHDTFIIEPDFISKILNVFAKDKKIGLIGLVGTEDLAKDGIMWDGERCGDFYRLDSQMEQAANMKRIEEGILEVEAVDGFLMVTNRDIPWREDVFTKFHFYDVSQSFEFRRAGYKVVVPAQNPAWTIHDCGPWSRKGYDEERKKLLREYEEVFAKKTKLSILFLHSDKIVLSGLMSGFMELGHNVEQAGFAVSLQNFSENEKESVEMCLEEGHHDLVVTYDFSKSVSEACQAWGVKYLAWVYDSPLVELYTKSALNEVNYISVFDRKQKERLKDVGLKHLYYYPLAAEVDNFGGVVIGKTDERKYSADISFVGTLYDQGWFERILDQADEEIKEDAFRVAGSTRCIWDGKNNLWGKAKEKTLQFMAEQEQQSTWDEYHMDKNYFNEALLLVRKANEIERITILNKLAEKYQVVLYTGSDAKGKLKNVRIRPKVDYLAVMPKIFHLSKINLNITSRSIESGLPQRIWDVMGVGGFMLTNYQPEIEEYFEIGKEIEVYHDLDELMEKVEYYLTHDEERVRIAMNGYKKVREYHTYKARLKQILEEVFDYKEE